MNKNSNKTANKSGEQETPFKEKSSGYKYTPLFPDDVYEELPEMLKGLSSYFNGMGRQKDIFFFSALHVLSACMPKVHGMYHGKLLSPNIFGMVGGPSGSGKSAMEHALFLASLISRHFTEKTKLIKEDYKRAYAEYKKDPTSNPKPEKPKPTLFLLPANSTPAAMIRLLENAPHALIAETEIDTLRVILEQKGFDYSELLRKAYHHETYRYYRKTEDEYVEIVNMHLSLILTGTPEQLTGLLKSAENGMLSRVGFYVYDDKPVFISPFRKEYEGLTEDIQAYSKKVFDMFIELLEGDEKVFRFTPTQEEKFTNAFIPIVEDYHEHIGAAGVSVAMRLGVIFFRIAMVLTVLRGYQSEVLICSDADFELALRIIDVLSGHAEAVLASLPEVEETNVGAGADPERILKGIFTKTFDAKFLIAEFAKHGASKRTAFRVIAQMVRKGLVKKIAFGKYEKVASLASSPESTNPKSK